MISRAGFKLRKSTVTETFFWGGGYHERYSENVASMTFLDRKVAINPPAV